MKNADGSPRQVSPAEAALNWQTKNVVAQNHTMRKILKGQEEMTQRVDRRLAIIEYLIIEVKQRIQKLEKELYTIATTVKEFSIASQQITTKGAKRRHLQNQLKSLEGSSSSTKNPNPLSSSSSSYRLPPKPLLVKPRNTMQPIHIAPSPEPYMSNLPHYLQPPSPPAYQPQRADQPILLNQHLYDMFPRSYHHVIKPRYAEPELEPIKPKPKPNPRPDPPDPTTGASSKPELFLVDPINQPNPISSFLRSLTVSPQIPTINTIEDLESSPKSCSGSQSDSSIELMMQEPMQEETRVEDPIDPPPLINPTQPRRIYQDTTDNKTFFTIDGVPPSQWREQFIQMIA